MALIPVSKPCFSAFSISSWAVPVCLHSAMNAASAGIFAPPPRRQRMIRRQRQELGAEQRVGPGGENVELALAVGRGGRIEREADQQALRAADPVALHDAHLLGPALEPVEGVEQVLGDSR